MAGYAFGSNPPYAMLFLVGTSPSTNHFVSHFSKYKLIGLET